MPAKRSEQPHTRHIAGMAVLTTLAMMLVVFALMVNVRSLGPNTDFTSFYAAGTIVKDGLAHRLYDFNVQLRTLHRIQGDGPEPVIFIHPPFESLVFLPLAYLSYSMAYVIWGLLNVAALGLSVYLLKTYTRNLTFRGKLVVIAGMFYPFIIELRDGQDSALLLLIFVLAFRNIKKRTDFTAGCILGLGLFRFQFILPFLFIVLMRKRWKIAMGVLAAGSSLAMISLAILGWDGSEQYVRAMLAMTIHSPKISADWAMYGRYVPLGMPNLRGMLFGLCGTLISSSTLGMLTILGSLALLAWPVRMWRGWHPDRKSFDALFSLSVVVTLMVAYHEFPHNLLLLLLPIFLMLDRSSLEVPLARPLLLLFAMGLYLNVRSYGGYWILFAPVMCFAVSIAAKVIKDRRQEVYSVVANKSISAGSRQAQVFHA